MSDFGDFDDDDAYDTAPPDPEQVARRLHQIRRNYGLETRRWDDLDHSAQVVRTAVVGGLLTWLRRQGGIA